ncbi:MAG: 3-phosphoshikimate 1-carboxyvinyltransferase [Ruminococcaceae bacterium]|nr:3-phosphoshikimate 1-carboxyvinyltransferase [Oscillospiraceae bacterium]
MNVTITPRKLEGSIEAIASKSYAHRIIMASALADKPTEIECNGISKDIEATVNAVNALGASARISKNIIIVEPIKLCTKPPVIPVSESGTTARMILPIATALYNKGVITGEGSLLKRPFAPLCSALSEHGINFSDTFLPICFEGEMTSGEYKISGSESSQYISALMFALPLLNGESCITLTSPLSSKGYIDITTEVLQKYEINGGFNTKGNERFISPKRIKVEGDWSNAAFWLAAGINVNGLNTDSMQRDKIFMSIKDNEEIDADDIPDLVPILSVYAASKKKRTRIYNAQRLRIKESDRLESVSQMIKSLGGNVVVSESELIINGSGKLKGGTVNSYNDHRIVMSAAIASCICENKVIIQGAEAVNKSYPQFFEHFRDIGGIINVE